VFLEEDVGYKQEFSANILISPANNTNMGVLTCNFLAVAELQSLPPPRPEDRCDELRLVACLVACGGRKEGRLFHMFCGKFGRFLTAFVCVADGVMSHVRFLLVRAIE
jgi:hypothetical protein